MGMIQRLLNNHPTGVMETKRSGELKPITPAHFLMKGGEYEDIVPPNIYLEGSDTLGEKYWTIKRLVDDFWALLCRSVPPKLREHNKWITKRKEIQEGDLVCMLRNLTATSRWESFRK